MGTLIVKAKPFLFLDKFSSSVAFSLRQLKKNYSGPVLKIRRDSDSATQDVGFVDGVLDTAAALSFVGSGTGFVATWYDQGDSGLNATNATTNEQPTIINSGIVNTASNGLPALRFDGIDDNLLVGSILSETTNGNSAYCVAEIDPSVIDFRRVLSNNNNRFTVGSLSQSAHVGRFGNVVSGSSDVVAGSYSLFATTNTTVTNDSQTAMAYLNGRSFGSYTTTVLGYINYDLYISCKSTLANPFKGNIQECAYAIYEWEEPLKMNYWVNKFYGNY